MTPFSSFSILWFINASKDAGIRGKTRIVRQKLWGETRTRTRTRSPDHKNVDEDESWLGIFNFTFTKWKARGNPRKQTSCLQQFVYSRRETTGLSFESRKANFHFPRTRVAPFAGEKKGLFIYLYFIFILIFILVCGQRHKLADVCVLGREALMWSDPLKTPDHMEIVFLSNYVRPLSVRAQQNTSDFILGLTRELQVAHQSPDIYIHPVYISNIYKMSCSGLCRRVCRSMHLSKKLFTHFKFGSNTSCLSGQ